MATIVEGSLVGVLSVATSPNTGTASWTDHTATVSSVSLSRGGAEPFVGVFSTDVGSGSITLVENTASIDVGHWVRVSTTGGNVWGGFVSDIQEEVRVLRQQTYTVKRLIVLDWVAWFAQIRGSSFAADRVLIVGTQRTFRPQLLNAALGFNAVDLVVSQTHSGGGFIGSAPYFEDINWAEMLDLTCNSVSGNYWHATKNVPTNGTTGRTGLAKFSNTAISSSGIVFTDGTHTGTPSNLCRYSDILVSKETGSIVNTVVYKNTNGVYKYEFGLSDTTSVTAYGSRSTVIDTNAARIGTNPFTENLFPYPSFENYKKESTDAAFYYSIETPTTDSAGTWNAYDGTFASRTYCNVAAATVANPLDERVPVTEATQYYGFAWGANSATASSRGRFFIQWINEAGAVISTEYGAYINFTNNRQWYKCSHAAVAPTGARYARVGIQHSRSTGATFPVGSKSWTDGVYFGVTNATDFYDGDTADTTSTIYYWAGSSDASVSRAEVNVLNTNGNTFLTANATARKAPKQIVWNAQDNIALVDNLDLYQTIVVWFKGQQWTQVVTGISHDITTNGDGTDRWLVTLTLRPAAAT